jgi:hypothetical protein
MESILDQRESSTSVPQNKYGEEDFSPQHEQPRHPLRQKKGRIFGRAVFRELGMSMVSSPSDPEDAPNRPHSVPPLEDSSDFGGSGVQRPYTTHKKVLEITELLQGKTASSNITLQRLAELESSLGAKERTSLAKSAAAAAQKEYNRMRNIRKPAGSRVSVLARNAEVPLPDVQSDREYVHRVQLQAERLRLGMQGFAAFQESLGGVGSVKGCLAEISAATERRDAGAETAEIR